jgi:hypothetical protein
MGNPLGINGPLPRYFQPGTPTVSGSTGVAAGNPAPNPQIVVGAPPPANAIGPQVAYVQPPDVPRPGPPPTVAPLSVESNLVKGPLPPPVYVQPSDVVRAQVPVPPPGVAGGPLGLTGPVPSPNYEAPADPPPTVATVSPNTVSGNPLKIEGPQAPYQTPGTDAPQGVQGIVPPLRQDSGVVLLENAP